MLMTKQMVATDPNIDLERLSTYGTTTMMDISVDQLKYIEAFAKPNKVK